MKKLLWLPPDYQSEVSSTVNGSCIAIVTLSNQVTFITINLTALPGAYLQPLTATRAVTIDSYPSILFQDCLTNSLVNLDKDGAIV